MEAASLHQLLVDLERPLSAELAAAKEAERFFDCELRRRREALSEWTERNSLKMRRPLTDYFTVSLCTAGSVLVFVISVAISVLGHRSSVHFWAWVDLFFDSSFFAFGAVPLGIVLCAFACSVCAARPREFREGSFGRVGGEEFAAVLRNNSREAIEAVTERLLQRISEAGREVDGIPVHLSASIGGASLTQEHGNFQDIMVSADKALYRAKRNGLNRAVFVPASAAAKP